MKDYLIRSIDLDAEDAPADLESGPLAVALYRASSEQYLGLHLCVEASKKFFEHCERYVLNFVLGLILSWLIDISSLQ